MVLKKSKGKEAVGNAKGKSVKGKKMKKIESKKTKGKRKIVELDEDYVEEEGAEKVQQDVKCSKIDLEDMEIFLDNTLTVGGKVKARKEVVLSQHEFCNGNPPNMNCRVESLGAVISKFGKLETNWVKEMGFGGLLNLCGKRLPRTLCYWLMSRLDPVRGMLVINRRLIFPLSKEQIHWVLGLPATSKKVPRSIHNDCMQQLVDDICGKYGQKAKDGRVYVPTKRVIERLERPCTESDELEFKIAFLIVVLGDFLCPTTCSRLSNSLFPALTVAKDAENYDWCGLVLEKLFDNGRVFAQSFYQEGYSRGCGGCTYFLAIFYLDRLNRQPVSWGVFPRVRAWKNDDVNIVKNADRICNDDGVLVEHGDYGKNTCIDIAYGERHPYVARDTMGPHSLAEEVAKSVVRLMGNETHDIHGVSGRGLGCEYEEMSDEGEARPQFERRKGRPVGVIPFKSKVGPALKKKETVVKKKGSENSGEKRLSKRRHELPRKTRRLILTVDSDDFSIKCDDKGKGNDNITEPENPIVKGNSERNTVNLNIGQLNLDEEKGQSGEKEMEGGKLCEMVQEKGKAKNCIVEEIMFEKESMSDTMGAEGGVGTENSVSQNELTVSQYLGQNFVNDDDLRIAKNIASKSEKSNDRKVVEELGKSLEGVATNADAWGYNHKTPENKESELHEDGSETGDRDCIRQPRSQSSHSATDSPKVKKQQRSKCRRVIHPTAKQNDYIVDHFPRSSRQTKTKLVRYVTTIGNLIVDGTITGLEYEQKNVPLLRTEDMWATLMSCYSVVSPSSKGVDDEYVRAAASLYTQIWKDKFGDRGVRYMVDPTFFLRVEKETGPPHDWKDTKRLSASYAKRFAGISVDRFHVIFVPILNDGHWWCACVCVNSETVWVIDSASLRSGVKQKKLLEQICNGVDILLNTIDNDWVVGHVNNWDRKIVKMEAQEDGNSCGVRMLLAVKACAERFVSDFRLRSPICEERSWLLNEDVMQQRNLAKAEVKRLIDSFED